MEATFAATRQPLATNLSSIALSSYDRTTLIPRSHPASQASDPASATSLVFIDSSVNDYQSLLAGVQPGTEVHLLDTAQDAIDQITQTLLGRTNLTSLHIVSHGQAGGLALGSNWLSLANLRSYSSELQSWGNALTDDADILLYGCDVGEGAIGHAFVQQLARLTGADIAASDNLTGSSALGGDWTLEVNTGTIDTPLAFLPTNMQSYGGVLDDAIFASAQQYTAGSLGTTTKTFVDSSGNVYITGPFSGTVDFDPGAGSFNLTSASANEVFVSKLDASGNFAWAKGLGGISRDGASGISVDSSGNVYVTGSFSGTVDFDPGAESFTLTSAGAYDIFVSKLDASGNFVWAKGLGGNGGGANGISVDSSGNVYTTGYFSGTGDFDPGTGTFNLTSTGVYDTFVSKLDVSGNFVWAKSMGGGSTINQVTSSSIDSSGNVYTTGYFSGTGDFDPGTGTFNLTSDGTVIDIFVSKLDADGSFVWAKRIGSRGGEAANGISIDSAGNVYTTGYFQGIVDFDPGAGVRELSSRGTKDTFVSKLDTNGNFVWARSIGGITDTVANGISVDSAGNVYTTGYFSNTVDFDPGTGTVNLTAAGSADIFVSKLNNSGNFVWAKRMGGNYDDRSNSISINSSDDVYITGYFIGTANLDSGTGIINIGAGEARNLFLSRLSTAGNFISVQQFTDSTFFSLPNSTVKTFVDELGNVYTVGSFSGTIDFDPGIGTTFLTSTAGSVDIFVSKLDNSGNFVWVKRIGGSSSDVATSISVDSSSNVYTTGYFIGTVDFDPGIGTTFLTSAAGSADIFVSKLDNSGNFVWAKRMGGNYGDVAKSISVDNNGNVYTTGWFYDTADFDPGPGIANLTTAGISDIFVSKLDTNGNFIWAKRIGGSRDDEATSIGVNSGGNVYITGFASDTADFDPGSGTVNLASTSTTTIFVSKLDSNGNLVWAKRIGDNRSDSATGISIDSSSNVYTTGYFFGTADFDPGSGTINLTSAGNSDIFVSKLDTNGNFVWAKRMGGASSEAATGISIDSSGSVYTTGYFSDTADFDPGAGIMNLTAIRRDIFVSKLDGNGNFVWAKGMGGSVDDSATSINVDNSGKVYTTGYFSGAVDFDPGTGDASLTTGGATNIFLLQLSQVPAPTISLNATSLKEGTSGTTTFTFTVNLSNPSAQTVSVNYTTADGTATVADNDYTAVSGVLTFNPSETSKTITVFVKGDRKDELDETFLVKLLNPTNATIAPNADTGTGTIVNDDHADLIWRNGGTGENAVWQLHGFTLQSSYYLPTVAEPGWQIVSSTTDFNHDGMADLLWRNQITGANAIWQMNSTGYQTGYFLTSVADASWQIVSTADFNRDKTPDLLWRNSRSGENAIWQMNGFTVQTTTFITSVADPDWQIASTADFNGDSTPDILWRNSRTGENAIWQMNGFTVQTTAFITSVADRNWQIAGTADFNGDGKADIVWRNQASGENAIWRMNGMTLQSGYFINRLADVNWQIAGVSDLGGDSTPDLLWRNQQAGKAMIWQLSGFSYAQTYQLPDVLDRNWSVKPFIVA